MGQNVLWRPSPPTNGREDDDSANERRTPLQRHLDEEREFRRIRSLRLDDIHASPSDWDPHSLVITTPPPKLLRELIGQSLALGQEVALTAAVLAVHGRIVAAEADEEEWTLARDIADVNQHFLIAVVLVGATLGHEFCDQERRRAVVVAAFLFALVCFASRVLRPFTASLSHHAIYVGALGGMALHLLAERGFVFATVLLATRIKSTGMSYAFASTVVALLSICPNPRHSITVALSLAVWLLLPSLGKIVFGSLQLLVMVVSPCVQWRLQRQKRIITGPWDIAHIRVPT